MLAQQTSARALRVVFWNSDYRRTEQNCRQIAGRPLSHELHASAANVGGMGWFLTIRDMKGMDCVGSCVTFGDDRDVSIISTADLESQ